MLSDGQLLRDPRQELTDATSLRTTAAPFRASLTRSRAPLERVTDPYGSLVVGVLAG
jgi:hypothetical protein